MPITPREENRYDLHKICAETGRHILLDLEVLTEIEIKDASETGPFATWLNLIEGHVESYRYGIPHTNRHRFGSKRTSEDTTSGRSVVIDFNE